MTELSINVNKVASLRNLRDVGIPNVADAARVAINAGVYGITVHPQPDQRHIRASDVGELRSLAKESGVEFNMEGNPFPDYMEHARTVIPDQCTLVPDDPNASTSDHGFDLEKDGARLEPIVKELRELGCRVSLFMDPVPDQIRIAREVGADRVELYTEPFASAFAAGDASAEFARYSEAGACAAEVGLDLNAGHDLNLDNLPLFCTIPNLLEVSIGHAIIADALFMGLDKAVKAYLDVIAKGNRGEV